MANTWRAYSKEILGYVDENPSQITVEYVVTHKVQKFINRGWSESRIFLSWNGGESATECKRGVNKYGVKYDSCDYVQKALAILTNL